MPQTPLGTNSALIFSPTTAFSLENNLLTTVEFELRPGRVNFNEELEQDVCSTIFSTVELKVRQVYVNPDAVLEGYTLNSVIGLGFTCQRIVPSEEDPNNIEEIDNVSII